MEAAAATAPVEASQEPPEQVAVPVLAPNDAGTPAPAQRTVAALVSAPNDASTPAPAERTAQVQGKAPGPRVAQQETLGPRVVQPETPSPRAARSEVRGPRVAQQGSPEAVPLYRENLQGKDRQVTVAELPGQSKTVNLTRGQENVWRMWSTKNPTRQRRRVGRSGRGER